MLLKGIYCNEWKHLALSRKKKKRKKKKEKEEEEKKRRKIRKQIIAPIDTSADGSSPDPEALHQGSWNASWCAMAPVGLCSGARDRDQDCRRHHRHLMLVTSLQLTQTAHQYY